MQTAENRESIRIVNACGATTRFSFETGQIANAYRQYPPAGPATGVGSYQKASETARNNEPARAANTASVLGIPASELTPKVQEAIARLMAEVDSMRRELDESRQRIEYLEQLAH